MSDATQSQALLVSQVRVLERSVRRLQAALFGGALTVCALGFTAFNRASGSRTDDVVTTRRLVLLDVHGDPGATIELQRPATSLDSATALGLNARSLRITVSDRAPDGDAAGSDTESRTVDLTLSGRGLAITLARQGHALAPRTSGMQLDAGPALVLTRGGQPVFRIDPVLGLTRPVTNVRP